MRTKKMVLTLPGYGKPVAGYQSYQGVFIHQHRGRWAVVDPESGRTMTLHNLFPSKRAAVVYASALVALLDRHRLPFGTDMGKRLKRLAPHQWTTLTRQVEELVHEHGGSIRA